jgi:hypothetical protein
MCASPERKWFTSGGTPQAPQAWKIQGIRRFRRIAQAIANEIRDAR